MRGSRPLARNHHPFLPKFFFLERAEFRTEVPAPTSWSARRPGRRVRGAIGWVRLRGTIRDRLGRPDHARAGRGAAVAAGDAAPDGELRAPGAGAGETAAAGGNLGATARARACGNPPRAGQAEPGAFETIRAERTSAVEIVGRNG